MNEDPKLDQILKTWKVEAPEAVRFQANVWDRIEKRRAATSPTFLEWLLAPLVAATPWRLATVSALVFILAGIGLGTVSASASNEKQRTEMQLRYVQSIDPYLHLNSPLAR